MVPSSRKVEKKQFKTLMFRGKWANSNHFNCRFLLTGGNDKSKVSVVVPKKIERRAVKRNALKRKLYVILKNLVNRMPRGLICVFFVTKPFGPHEEVSLLEEEMVSSLSRSGLL